VLPLVCLFINTFLAVICLLVVSESNYQLWNLSSYFTNEVLRKKPKTHGIIRLSNFVFAVIYVIQLDRRTVVIYSQETSKNHTT